MPATPRLRTIARWTALFSAAGIALLLSNQHRVRLIFGSFTPVASVNGVNWDPALTSDERRFMSDIHPTADTSSDVQRAAMILAAFQTAHPPVMGDPLPALDDPDTCLARLTSGQPTHCYNLDIAASGLLAHAGIYSRIWDLNGPRELGGFGHNVLEVWDRTSHSWRVLDPYYHCYFIADGDSTALSFSRLRELALTSPAHLHVVHYLHTPSQRLDKDIIAEHSFLDSLSMLHANNDYRWRFDHRYGALMPFASLLDKLPLRTSRAVRTLMLGNSDARYVIEDRYSPHYPYGMLGFAFNSLVILFALSFIASVPVPKRLAARAPKAVGLEEAEPRFEAVL